MPDPVTIIRFYNYMRNIIQSCMSYSSDSFLSILAQCLCSYGTIYETLHLLSRSELFFVFFSIQPAHKEVFKF